MSKMNSNKLNSVNILMLTMLGMIIATTNVYAVSNEQLKWSEGDTYTLKPTDNMVTQNDYTIKAIDFPSPARGRRTVNDTIVPANPVAPFVTLELYKDMVNNTTPIVTFSLLVGDEYITEDQELRITISDIPGSDSQDWVYEYYNPWASVRMQKRAVPNLNIDIILKDVDDNEIDTVDPGESFKVEVDMKNTGDDVLKNMNYHVDPDPLLIKSSLVASNILTDTIYDMAIDEEKKMDMTLVAPAVMDDTEYYINVNVTGHDAKDISYNWNNSNKIFVRNATECVWLNKTTKDTVYLKENVNVILNIANRAPLAMNHIEIYDTIPDSRLLFRKDNTFENITEFLSNKSSIEPGESLTLSYILKPREPGIYVLPEFKVNYSMGGREISKSSNEVGFRVFGPIVVLNKSAMNKGNEVIEVKVTAKNIGNGFTIAKIEDELPENATIISGSTNLSTSLDVDAEKTMTYTIKIPGLRDINSMSLPPARATYYLDDYKFSTSSDEKIAVSKEALTGTPVGTSTKTPIEAAVAPPKSEEPSKKVVATIPAKTPVQTPEKKYPIPGFRYYELLSGIFLITILSLLRNKLKAR